MRTSNHRIRGITVIDVLISVVVMGIIASVIIPSIMTKTEEESHNTNLTKAIHIQDMPANHTNNNDLILKNFDPDLETVSLTPSSKVNPELDGF